MKHQTLSVSTLCVKPSLRPPPGILIFTLAFTDFVFVFKDVKLSFKERLRRKMTAKKRWLSKIPSEEHPDITWSQSDFDEQKQPGNPNKKLKCDLTGGGGEGSSWMKLLTPPKEFPLDQETEILDHSGELFPSPSESEESPVLSKLKENELSPVIRRIRKPQIIYKQRGRSRDSSKVHKIEWIEPLLHIVESSPDIFWSTQSTSIHSVNEVDESPVKISPVKSEEEPEFDIQPVASQHTTEVSEEDACPSGSSADRWVSLYHQPPPKKKRFKKGSLANQLQKVLNLQKSSLGIWQHELYLNENQTDETGVQFKVQNKLIEYGRTLLECESSDLGTFLLHIDRNLVNYIDFKLGDSYKMFPPFSNKPVQYKSNECVCYYNVTRFISS